MPGPKPTTEQNFVLKAKGLIGDTARYLWANITGEREREFSMRDIETPREWIDRSDPDYTPSIYNQPRDYLRAELPDVRKVGVAAYAKAKIKQGVVRQMTKKNKGYMYGANQEYGITIKGSNKLVFGEDIEASTKAVLRAIDKLPDDEFRQIYKIDMLNEAEYANEAAGIGQFSGFYRSSLSTKKGAIAIRSGQSSEDVSDALLHEVSHGKLFSAEIRPVIGYHDKPNMPIPKMMQGNKPISPGEAARSLEVIAKSPASVPYKQRPLEIQARITTNIMKALPSKMFKDGKVPQSVYDGIIRASSEAALKIGKPVSSAPTIKGTKGWKFIPEGSDSPFIMTKGESAISEKIDSAGNMYYQVRITASLGNDLVFPDRFNTLEQAIKLANTFEGGLKF